MAVSNLIKSIKPADLPAPPEAALRIMRACSREKANSAEIANLAATDPVLTAELLRVVNSPFFGLGREIKSIPRAITILGHRALRNLALCISVRDALKQDSIPGFDTTVYWEDALRRAVSARLLAREAGMDPDECFTAGLLQDFGLLVMFFLNPDKAAVWNDLQTLDPDSRLTKEQEIFDTSHDQVVMLLAQTWTLPDELAVALGDHHSYVNDVNNIRQPQLARLLYCSDWMTAVYTAADKNTVIERCHRILHETFNTGQQHTEKLLSDIPNQVEEAAAALGLRINQQTDYEQILHEANARLAEENLSYQELTWRLENTLKERDRLAEELNKELDLARDIQRSMLPAPMTSSFPITGVNIPARELSGDFFDYFYLNHDSGKIYFNLGDVSGKGINAALLMAKTSSLFRCLGKQVHQPSQLLAQINSELCETSTRGMFVTMVAGVYDPVNDRLSIVNAGHLPALLIQQDGTTRLLDAQAPPLGITSESTFLETEITLDGGCLYIFSDGITEGHLVDGSMLGIQGLVKLLAGLNKKPAQQRLQIITDYFNRTTSPLHDDITLLIVEAKNDGA